MSTAADIDLTRNGAIAHLRLNRPAKLNALDRAMVARLAARCAEIEADDDIRVVILSGEGKAFCAGGDIEAWASETPDSFGRHWLRDGHAAFDALARLRQPVIAVLDGHALGGGLELAACADIRVAEEQIKAGQPETGLGIIPGWSGTQRAVRRFGAQVVRRMVLAGEVFTADEALGLGLVDRVVPKGQAMAAAEELAATLLTRSPRATELAKMMINHAEGEERERIAESLAGALAAHSPDLAEGLAAFRERRTPNFLKDKDKP
ncbi:enoyl-CoA hydratase/isomerase family protein [Ovoidimarina sediminis]|uniref:enoyl-CoA hydratase/isomerase family protein n=1 Tax=Ovoidimarina sediminis TaxID=3079856 RepID=UPI00290D0A8D|nr:enoyl-CoA hydratase/isomerase family protein [Rhodophyticola sp. MJ-SS7]MDU8944058.1 enoyl-CoA hydratase/isomerase family protein [Rhodophyticola sp. MJ-SS7]